MGFLWTVSTLAFSPGDALMFRVDIPHGHLQEAFVGATLAFGQARPSVHDVMILFAWWDDGGSTRLNG